MVRECLKKCLNCGHNGHNSKSCSFKKDNETCVKLFGVNINVVPEKQHGSSNSSSASSSKKKGVPWTEEEHLSFLRGLEKIGKGKWSAISSCYVHSRTPTQVASHAQKHFNRLQSNDKRNRRSSLFDMSLNGPEIQKTPPESSNDMIEENQKLAHKSPAVSVNQNESSEEQENTLVIADATPLIAAPSINDTSCYGGPSFSDATPSTTTPKLAYNSCYGGPSFSDATLLTTVPNLAYNSCYGGPSFRDATPSTTTPNVTYNSCYGGPNLRQMQYYQEMGMAINGQIFHSGNFFSAMQPVPMMCIPETAYYYLPISPGSQASNTVLMTTFPHGSSLHMARH